MNVLASPLVPNSPLTPKSQSLTWPSLHKRILDGLMSEWISGHPVPGGSKQTSMDNLPAVKIGKAVQDTLGNFSKDFLAGPASELLDFLVYAIQASSRTELHSNRYRTGRLVHKSAVVAADMIRGAIFIKIELPDDLLLHVGVRIRRNNLLEN